MRTPLFISAACLLVVFGSCKKPDYCHEPPRKDSTCDLMQAFITINASPEDGGGTFSQYRKEFDNSGQVHKVVAGLYTLYLYDSVSLLLHYNDATVYFLSEKNPSDTFVTATFDAQHRLQELTAGNAITADGSNPFYTLGFYYEGARLSGIFNSVSGSVYHLNYDANGNVVRMHTDADSAEAGTFYTYDLTVSAKRQFYTDGFINGSENALYLAQFLGWLPDLEPKNKRTSYKIVYNDEDPTDDIPPYVFAHADETGHVYDSNGNLLRYSGDYDYTNVWSCAAKASHSPN